MGYNKYITLEQRAEAYDEAIRKAQDVLHTSKFINITDLFPELQEDKDEMIKNFICNELACLRATDEKGSDRYNELTEAIGWVEKRCKKESQGKSAIEAWKEMRLEVYAQASGNRHEPNYSDDSTKMFSLTDIDEIFEKITEIQSEHTDPCHTCDHQVLSCNDFPCEKKQSEQNSDTNSLTNNVWGEVDEKMLDDACIMLDWYKGNNWWKAQYIKNWLKSLKDRIQPQPKQEWSEEDEEMLDGIILRCEKYGYQEQIDWLKSLRPQNSWIIVDKEVYVKEPVLAQKKDKSDQFQGYVLCCDHTLMPNVYERYMILSNINSWNRWKPSDEQITWLYRAVDEANKDSRMKQILNELLSDLKKLKGE